MYFSRPVDIIHNDFPLYHGNSIYYVSGGCGTGKTLGTCLFIREHIQKSNFLYVAPSSKLGSQTAEYLRSKGVIVRVINSKTNPGTVKRDIIQALKTAPECGLVIVVNWQAYVGLPFFPQEKNFQDIIDEIPQLDEFFPIRLLPENVDQIADWIDIRNSVNEYVGEVVALDGAKLGRYLGNVSDDVKDIFIPILKEVASPNKVVYVDLRSWNRVIENQKRGKSDAENTVYFVTLLKPDFLHNAIMLGANFENSLLYHWFQKQYGTRFQEFNEISQHLRPVETASRAIEICYFIEGSYFSKSMGKKCFGQQGTLVEIMDKAAVEFFGDEKFLYIANNDRESASLSAAKGRRISAYSHGLNFFDGYHNIYFSAALNRSPQHFKLLEDLGIDSSHVHSATTHEVVYQAVMRLSLRNPDATSPVKILVADEYMAKRVGELLSIKEIYKIGDINLFKREPLNQGQINRRAKTKKMIDCVFTTNRLGFPSIKGKPHQNVVKRTKILGGGNCKTCFVTFHKDEFAKSTDEFLVREFELQGWVSLLRRCSKNIADSKKNEAPLFNGAIFEPSNDISGYRKQSNFSFSCMLVLDFDDGQLSPEKFEEIFWHRAGRGLKRSFIISNSFSRSPEQPNRFRVIFPYKKPAKSIDEHKAVLNSVIARLKDEGFSTADMGLDPQCKSGIQSFYLPCTNRSCPDYAFFRTHGTNTRDIEQYGIDPSTYWKTAKPERARMPRKSYSDEITVELSPELSERKSTLMAMTENRHYPFFMFGLRLASHFKKDRSMVERHLQDVARTDRKMSKWMKDVLKSLEKYGWI